MDSNKKIVVFASGGPGPDEGGSGFRTLKQKEISGELGAHIAAVISNHPKGGIATKAQELGVPFEHITKPYIAQQYQHYIQKYEADIVALSGYLKHIDGIDPVKCINIHPGPLAEYGGPGMYGHHVHDKIYQDLMAGKIKRTCVSMHFVTPQYDDPQGLIFQYPVELDTSDTPATIAQKVNKIEHERQWKITRMVAHGEISAERDAENQKIINIKFPENYERNKVIDLTA